MGRYADNLKLEGQFDNIDALLNDETANGKIGSLKEVLNLLSQTPDGATKLVQVINSAIDTKIAAAIAEGGAIETWGDGRYTLQNP